MVHLHPQFSRSLGFFLPTALLQAGVSAAWLFLAAPAIATPLGHGQNTFDRAPRLVQLSSSSTQTNVSGARYQLTITVPADAGAPLQAIAITQPQNQATVRFQLDQTRVVAGNPATEIALASIGGAAAGHELVLELHHPVQPGQTVTLTLQPERNPADGGVYLFGVTAYPTGENSPGLFLGYSRLTFQAPSGR